MVAACFDVYDLLGYRIAVSAPSSDAQVAIRSILREFGPLGIAPAPVFPRYTLDTATEGWRVSVNDTPIYTGADFLVALANLEWHALYAAVQRRDDALALHAAALRLPARPASLLLIGESGKGKTTLALALLERGFTPFSDDVALVAPDTLGVRAVRRAFHIREGTWQAVAQVRGAAAGDHIPGAPRSPEPAGSALPEGYYVPQHWATRAAPVRWIIFPHYQPGRDAELLPLAPMEAAIEILAHATNVMNNPALALETTARLTERARCYRCLGGDLPGAVASIEGLIADDAISPH